MARRGTDQMEWAVEVEIGDGFFEVGNVDLEDGLASLVLEGDTDVSVEGASLRINIDGGIDRRYLGLEQVFVLLELAFVVRLNVAARFGIEIFIEDVGVVKVPAAGAGGDESEKHGGLNQAGRALQGQPRTGAQGVFGTATGEGDRNHSQHGCDREPIGN